VFLFFLVQSAFAISSISDCNLQGWDLSRLPTKNSLHILRERYGKECVAKFTLSPNDPQINEGTRAEIKDPFVLITEQSTVHTFWVMLPSSVKNANTERMVFAQWHDYKIFTPNASRRPPLSMRLHQGQFVFILFNDEISKSKKNKKNGVTLGSVPVRFNQWMKIRVSAKWSATKRGFINANVDGNDVANYFGPIGYKIDTLATYFKMGPYSVNPFDDVVTMYVKNYSREVLFEPPLTQFDK
jgi:hypothetical protein